MLDRLAMRTAFWGTLATISLLTIAIATGAMAMPSFVAAAPFLSALALLVAITGWRLLHRELLRRMQNDETLQLRMRRLHDAMHASMDGLLLLRTLRDRQGEIVDFEIAEANGRAAALLYQKETEVTGLRLRRDFGGLGVQMFERYRDAVTFMHPVNEAARTDRRVVNASWVMHQATPTTDGIAVTLRDISMEKREEMRLRKASYTDDLTRLHNRRGFMALADQQLRVARRHGKDSVVLYVDMNGFKELNDTYGHAMGDKALVEVARLLRSTVRECDVVARLGGDEFTILALDADGTGARVIQKRIEDALQQLNTRNALPCAIGLTIGHTRVRPSDPAGISELLSRADQLLYARKRRRALAASMGSNAPVRAPRRTPRTVPAVPIPPEVAAVAIAAARSLATTGTPSAITPTAMPTMGLPAMMPTTMLAADHGATSPA